MARRRNRPIKAGQVYGSLRAVAEDAASAKYPSQRWWSVECRVCGYTGRALAGWLHTVSRGPDPSRRIGTGCPECSLATRQMPALEAVNAAMTPERRAELSRRAHESMTPEQRAERARKGGLATAGKPRKRK